MISQNKKIKNLAHSEIHSSWYKIEQLEKNIFRLKNKKNWEEVLKIQQLRKAAIHQHFTEHPVSPATSFFYRSALSQHINTDREIEKLQKLALKNTLTLIHNSP